MGPDLITKDEREQIQQRLAELKANRPVMSNRIAEARALGDLRENSEYHAAKEQQGLEEAEIKRLQARLATAQVVSEENKSSDVVFLGSMVKLRDVDDGDEDVYKLVGEASSKPSFDYVEVTVTSPMGEALMKARIGEEIRVDAPRGVKRFKVVEIL
jgi:transcription elongation factor GreA